ncbi:Hypothetical predicted protein [Marmota monax]|uniref:Uncharacterized protein n=1 Tax=Marmota monax TaxID=9995 RepID=A0A5E4CS15_MARMO|nr:hypothetical protein GHT09_015283 [Marmota monax]VTJ84584.1 Hypothetical predicted protein [Marmota monax]
MKPSSGADEIQHFPGGPSCGTVPALVCPGGGLQGKREDAGQLQDGTESPSGADEACQQTNLNTAQL